jgi:hypothetical protein
MLEERQGEEGDECEPKPELKFIKAYAAFETVRAAYMRCKLASMSPVMGMLVQCHASCIIQVAPHFKVQPVVLSTLVFSTHIASFM